MPRIPIPFVHDFALRCQPLMGAKGPIKNAAVRPPPSRITNHESRSFEPVYTGPRPFQGQLTNTASDSDHGICQMPQIPIPFAHNFALRCQPLMGAKGPIKNAAVRPPPSRTPNPEPRTPHPDFSNLTIPVHVPFKANSRIPQQTQPIVSAS